MLLVLLAFCIGLAIGAGALWLLGRRSKIPDVIPLRTGQAELPSSLPALKGAQIWLVPDEGAQQVALEALARACSQRGPVLLILTAASRQGLARQLDACRQVYWLEQDRPECQSLLQAATSLRPGGPVTLLVQGSEALEPTAPEEPTDAVVEELADLAQHDDLILVLQETERLPRKPDVRLRAAEGGLALEGELLVEVDEGGGRFVG